MEEVFKVAKLKTVTDGVEPTTCKADIKFIRSMEYSVNRCKPAPLTTGEYRGLTFYVVTLGTHPCAYVNVAGTELDGTDTDEMDDTGIECHGGFTYAESTLYVAKGEGWFVGWDYAHCEDWCGYMESYKDEYRETHLKRHNTLEMIRDCMDVIDQIVKRTKKRKTVRRHKSAQRI